MKLLFLFLFSLSVQSQAIAAACCGGSSAVPSLITNDDRQLWSFSFVQSHPQIDVSSDRVWSRKSNIETNQIYKLDVASIFSDIWQWGISSTFHQKSIDGNLGGESSGLGDLALQLGYEYLPEWSYHPIRPKAVAFLTLNIPFGKSIYESDEVTGVDSRGKGFYSLGIGSVFLKNWRNFDLNILTEFHQSMNKEIRNQQMNGTLQPGHGYSTSFGAGWNQSQSRLGFSIGTFFEEGIDFSGDFTTQGQSQSYTNATFTWSYMLKDDQSLSLSYSDQSLFGNPKNLALAQSVQILFQKKIAR